MMMSMNESYSTQMGLRKCRGRSRRAVVSPRIIRRRVIKRGGWANGWWRHCMGYGCRGSIMMVTSYWLSSWGYRSFILWLGGISIWTGWGWRYIFGLLDRRMYRSRRWSKMLLFLLTLVMVVVFMVVVVVVVVVLRMILIRYRCWTRCVSTTSTVQRMCKIRRKAYLLYSAKHSVIQSQVS